MTRTHFRARRALRVTAVAAFAAVLLAACGSGGSSGNATGEAGATDAATEAAEATAEATDGAAEATASDVEYFFSAGDVPAEPQRVLALWRTGSSLAELGVVPVGTLEGEFLETELTPEQWAPVKDVPSVGSYEGVSLEDVIALDPDLIVGMDNGGLTIDYDELGELFPVRILSVAEPTDVWDNYEVLAGLVGKSVDYEEQEAALDGRLADIEAEHGDVLGDLTVTSFGANSGTIYVDTSKSLSFRRIDAAGFGYNPTYTDNPARYAAELTLENLPTLADQDAIFYSASIDGTVTPDVQAILDEPAFTELPAAQAGHTFPLRGAVVYTFAGQNLMVDDLEAAATALASAGQG